MIFLLHIHPSLGYHCTKRMQQTSTADIMSLFSVHKHYKLGPIFLRTVSMSTLYFHTALRGQDRSSLFALKVETNFLFQFDGSGFRSELQRNNCRVHRNPVPREKEHFFFADFLFRSEFRHYFHMFSVPFEPRRLVPLVQLLVSLVQQQSSVLWVSLKLLYPLQQRFLVVWVYWLSRVFQDPLEKRCLWA